MSLVLDCNKHTHKLYEKDDWFHNLIPITTDKYRLSQDKFVLILVELSKGEKITKAPRSLINSKQSS